MKSHESKATLSLWRRHCLIVLMGSRAQGAMGGWPGLPLASVWQSRQIPTYAAWKDFERAISVRPVLGLSIVLARPGSGLTASIGSYQYRPRNHNST